MKKKVVGLFIGRFQPGLHFGELDAIAQAMEQGVRHFLIGIGSSNKEFTSDNPFTYDERKTMIELSLRGMTGIAYQFFPIPDMDSDAERKNFILHNSPDFDVVITGNPWVRDIFVKGVNKVKGVKKVSVLRLKIRVPVKATFLREQLALGRMDELKKSLPAAVVAYLKKIQAEKRMKGLIRNERRTPNLCTDVIFTDTQGNLILIERKNYPYGIALPGGFVNYGEDPKDAAIREVKEETGATIKIKRLVGVYGNPARDPRAHNVSIVYEGEYLSGIIKAGDDAKAVKKVKCIKGELKKIKFCCDHGRIIQEYFAK